MKTNIKSHGYNLSVVNTGSVFFKMHVVIARPHRCKTLKYSQENFQLKYPSVTMMKLRIFSTCTYLSLRLFLYILKPEIVPKAELSLRLFLRLS
jgi:hypothetical protein